LIGWVLSDGSDSDITIFAGVVIGKVSLMGIGHPLAVGAKLVAPDEGLSTQSTARRELPFRFRRKPLTCPLGVCQRVFISDLHDGIGVLSLDVACRAFWMAPVRSAHIAPPLEVVVERYRVIGRRENDRAGNQVFGRSVG